MLDIQKLLNREELIFENDYASATDQLKNSIAEQKILVVGGAGSIGRAVIKELFRFKPSLIEIVDINENGLVELTRDLRSLEETNKSNFHPYVMDAGTAEFRAFMKSSDVFDIVFNFSAMKHVRSERDVFSISRMVDVNVFNSLAILKCCSENHVKKYFCVSTDKATKPINLMGASKLLMEAFVFQQDTDVSRSMARFANVLGSDGSLFDGYRYRIQKHQPLACPQDISRYFISEKEAAKLCILSAVLSENGNVYFPKKSEKLSLTSLKQLTKDFMRLQGYNIVEFDNVNDAFKYLRAYNSPKEWPVIFPKNRTTGEKDFEEFYTVDDEIDLSLFEDIGLILRTNYPDVGELSKFSDRLAALKNNEVLNKAEWVKLFEDFLPSFSHAELGRNLSAGI